MHLAFYKAFNPKATLLDSLIGSFSKGCYSHVEIVIDYNKDGRSFCIGSSARDGGVRKKHIFLKDEQWEVIQLNFLTNEQIMKIHMALNKYLGYKYDILGALTSIFGIKVDIQNRVFCSELVALTVLGVMGEPFLISDIPPSYLRNKILELNKKHTTTIKDI